MQGTRVSRDREFSWVFVHECDRRAETAAAASCEIICYTGKLANPQWMDTEPGTTARLSCVF